MIKIMRSKKMLFEKFCFLVGVLFLLVVTSTLGGGAAAAVGAPKLMMRRCRENERRALLEFKADIVDEFGILSSWVGNINSTNNEEEEECCNWRGIRCSNRTGHVTVVNIPGNEDEYYNFTHQWVGLSGKVSPSLIGLSELKYLNLSGNKFGGKIPHQLGNLTNLRSLDLGNNGGGLKVENLEWLSHFRSLTHLDLNSIDIRNSSDWLQQIYKLPFLTNLILSDCLLPDSPLLLPFNNTSFTLTSLAVVDLSRNHFISPSTYNWLLNFTTSLVSVDLSSNSFLSASIPEAFGRMTSLEYLNLARCRFEGTLPLSFRNLTRLDTLYLHFNNFSGTLTEFLHPLSVNKHYSLRFLSLGYNQLGGSLPDFITSFTSLQDMSLPYNKLNGPFPKNFGQLSGLVRLDLSYNQITGSFPNLTLFSSLEELTLFNNKLEDTVPEAYLSNLSNLKYLDLSMNSLSLKFSFDWVPPFQPDQIYLANCTLGPHFPNWLRSQRSFSVLDISAARISDTIPLWFWDHLPPNLRHLNMSYNNIQGMLPDLSLKFDVVDFFFIRIDLSYNLLEGPIASLPVNVGLLDLSHNMFTGSTSFLCKTPYESLSYLDLSNNQLSGDLPECLMNVNQLSVLILANNNFSGKIPTSIGLLNQLIRFHLRNNSFIGDLPSSLMNISNLQLLDLSENELSGEVPTWIGTHLTSLILLSLRKNKFSGSIHPQICLLRDAQVVDLSRNNLSGSIPNCINNLTSLVVTENINFIEMTFGFAGAGTIYGPNAVVQWKGVMSEYRKTLGLLKLIDLSSNGLVGQIPEEFASLEGLMSLNLSSNNLTGNIIPKIGQMKSLEILDLSRNQLTGDIPNSLASLTFLSVLDLSNNNLTGKIPSSTQLQSFDASKYAGNEQLCGLPLPNMCGDVLPPPSPVRHDKDENNEEEDDDDDKLAKIGLYVSVVLGFGTGFWGFLGPIMLRRTWRDAYYRMLGKITDWMYVTTTLSLARLQRKFNG